MLDLIDPCTTPEDRVEDGTGGDALLLIDESDLAFFFFTGSDDMEAAAICGVAKRGSLLAGALPLSSAIAANLCFDKGEVDVDMLSSLLALAVIDLELSGAFPIEAVLLRTCWCGGAVSIAENAWLPLAEAFGIISRILSKYGQPLL